MAQQTKQTFSLHYTLMGFAKQYTYIEEYTFSYLLMVNLLKIGHSLASVMQETM